MIGDAGLDAALDALDLAAAEVGEQRIRAAGHRFEHVEMADAGRHQPAGTLLRDGQRAARLRRACGAAGTACTSSASAPDSRA